MKDVELRKCPFCGRPAEMHITKHYTGADYYNPRCTEPSCVGRSTKKWLNKDHAVWSWNRRVSVRFDE